MAVDQLVDWMAWVNTSQTEGELTALRDEGTTVLSTLVGGIHGAALGPRVHAALPGTIEEGIGRTMVPDLLS
ncbi:MAG: hypothetical protein OJF50_005399 [Nitrospira sp.]|nr:hypothetical protein [Nitrospira sp.]